VTDAPTITFPCDYPIKIIGTADDDFTSRIVGIVQRHAPEVEGGGVQVRESRRGKYVAVTISILASGEPQLRALHRDLMQDAAVTIVL
jgi:putative lipoic acid-binding regulatory protein